MKEDQQIPSHEYLTFMLSDQMFGVPVLQVNDVLGVQKITPVPLSPPAVSGVMNLRGRIVTAINVRRCLGLHMNGSEKDLGMGVVIEQGGELFSLMIDAVNDVLSLNQSGFEAVPPTLDPSWRMVASGIFKLKSNLLIVLDVQKLLSLIENRQDREMQAA